MRSKIERICPGPLIFDYETLSHDEEGGNLEEVGFTKDASYQPPSPFPSPSDTKLGSQSSFLDIYAPQNYAITSSYFNSGFANKFIDTPITYYLITQLNASSSQMSALRSLSDLPWTLKTLFGMLSDGFPMNGYRRKPWFFIGWLGFLLANLLLVQSVHPSIQNTIFLSVVVIAFNALAEVCQDTLCVERARLEIGSSRGMLQTTVYTIKAFGAVLGAILGAVLYNRDQWGWGLDISGIFLLQAAVPLLTIALMWPLVELSSGHPIPSLKTQLSAMWGALKLRAVWRPTLFVFTYSMMQIPNTAMKNFLVKGLHFSDFELGLLLIGAAIFGWLGLVIYREFLFETSWRTLYIVTTLIGFVCSLLQLLMIYRINIRFGIPDIFFAIGDEAVFVLMDRIHTMPLRIMYIALISDGLSAGSEASTFALLTSIHSLGSVFGVAIGGVLTKIFDVSNASLEVGDFRGLERLTISLSVVHVLPLGLIWMLPDTREEQRELRESKEQSTLAGGALALIILSTVLFALIVDVNLVLSS